MADLDGALKVILAPNGFYPHAFRWEGRTVRVLAVESLKTLGAERRYRVRTAEGAFELGLFTDVGAWRLERTPSWLGRLWASWQNVPRYPLPAWRRRVRQADVRPDAPAPYRRATSTTLAPAIGS